MITKMDLLIILASKKMVGDYWKNLNKTNVFCLIQKTLKLIYYFKLDPIHYMD